MEEVAASLHARLERRVGQPELVGGFALREALLFGQDQHLAVVLGQLGHARAQPRREHARGVIVVDELWLAMRLELLVERGAFACARSCAQVIDRDVAGHAEEPGVEPLDRVERLLVEAQEHLLQQIFGDVAIADPTAQEPAERVGEGTEAVFAGRRHLQQVGAQQADFGASASGLVFVVCVAGRLWTVLSASVTTNTSQ